MFWSYNDEKHPPVIKTLTQAGRINKAGRSGVVLDVDSTEPLTAGPGSRSLLRTASNRDRAASALRDCTLDDRDLNRTAPLT